MFRSPPGVKSRVVVEQLQDGDCDRGNGDGRERRYYHEWWDNEFVNEFLYFRLLHDSLLKLYLVIFSLI